MRKYTFLAGATITCLTGIGCDIIADINGEYRLVEGPGGGGGEAGSGASVGGGGMTSITTGGTTSMGGGGTTSTATGGTTSMGGGGAGGAGCIPESTMSCYTGPAGTEGIGACKSGVSTCAPAGTWGPCDGEVLPLAELCNTPVDDDCDGTALEPDAACLCLPGSVAPCYSGPPGTAGVGTCQDGTATCAPDGKGYGACTDEVLPASEDCRTSVDEDCDGVNPACAGGEIWSKVFGDSMSQVGRCVASEPGGGLFVGGYLYGSTDFGAGALTSAGGSDAFIARYGSNGTLVWAKKFGDGGSQETKAVARDASGGVVATGVFSGSMDFEPMGMSNPLVSAGSFDIFLARLDMTGTTTWAKRFGNSTNQYGQDVAVGSDGDIVMTGYFGGQVDFGGGLITSNGGSDAFAARFGADGSYKWGHKFGGSGNEFGFGVATQASGATVVTGTFTGSADFGTGSIISSGGADVFLVSLDGTGVTSWAKTFGSASDDVVHAIDVAPVGGFIAVAGSFSGVINFGGDALSSNGGKDAFVAIFGPTGNHLWSNSFGSDADDDARALAYDSQGNLFIAGSFGGGSMSILGTSLVHAGGTDVFVAKLDTGAALSWAGSYGDGANQVCYGVSTDSNGSVALTGSVVGAIDFGGGAITSSGTEDLFLAKLSP